MHTTNDDLVEATNHCLKLQHVHVPICANKSLPIPLQVANIPTIMVYRPKRCMVLYFSLEIPRLKREADTLYQI